MILAESSLLEWLVGSDPNGDGTPRLQWMNMPESWGVFVLLLICLLYTSDAADE